MKVALQVLLGLIFITSAVKKKLDMAAFTDSVLSYDIMPVQYVRYFVIVLITIELFVGFIIVASLWPRFGIISSIVLLTVFELFAIYSVVENNGWVCNCFGSFLGGRISYTTIIRNLIFISLALYVFFSRNKEYVFEKMPRIISNSIVVVFIAGCFALAMYYGEQKEQKEKLNVGSKIDNFSFVSIDGDTVDTAKRKKKYLLLVIFKTDDCPPCLLEYMLCQKIQKNFNESVLVIGIGSAPNHSFLKEWSRVRGISFPIYFDKNKELVDRYDLRTPIKILLNSNNNIIAQQKSNVDQKKIKLVF